jgi:hypothetical protein
LRAKIHRCPLWSKSEHPLPWNFTPWGPPNEIICRLVAKLIRFDLCLVVAHFRKSREIYGNFSKRIILDRKIHFEAAAHILDFHAPIDARYSKDTAKKVRYDQ